MHPCVDILVTAVLAWDQIVKEVSQGRRERENTNRVKAKDSGAEIATTLSQTGGGGRGCAFLNPLRNASITLIIHNLCCLFPQVTDLLRRFEPLVHGVISSLQRLLSAGVKMIVFMSAQ